MDGDLVAPRVLHAARHQDLRAAGGHLEHFLVADPREPPGGPDDPRVGGEDSVHVGVDLAHVGGQDATAVVSDAPRPIVVTSLVVCDTPWNPATMGIAPQPARRRYGRA